MKEFNIGKLGEDIAKEYLIKKGYTFLESNYHSRYGEIDIICEDDKYIIFVEVKTRKQGALVCGVDAVDVFKKVKIVKTALMYLANCYAEKQPRFDVIEITTNQKGECANINHFENAFDMEELGAFF